MKDKAGEGKEGMEEGEREKNATIIPLQPIIYCFEDIVKIVYRHHTT